MKEIWKDIEGYNGKYQVSSCGRIRNIKEIMSLTANRGGYLKLKLYDKGKIKYESVHRLVAKMFIPNPYNLPQVNHIDGNKKNNNIDNLEWIDMKGNNIHAIKTGLNKTTLTIEAVKYIRKHCIIGHKVFGIRRMAEKFNCGESVVADVIHKRTYNWVE